MQNLYPPVSGMLGQALDALSQGLATFFFKGADSMYFSLCEHTFLPQLLNFAIVA